MARMIEFNIKVDYRNVTEFLEKVNPVYEKQVIFVQGIHGIMSVFNVSYSKARELAQGVNLREHETSFHFSRCIK